MGKLKLKKAYRLNTVIDTDEETVEDEESYGKRD